MWIFIVCLLVICKPDKFLVMLKFNNIFIKIIRLEIICKYNGITISLKYLSTHFSNILVLFPSLTSNTYHGPPLLNKCNFYKIHFLSELSKIPGNSRLWIYWSVDGCCWFVDQLSSSYNTLCRLLILLLLLAVSATCNKCGIPVQQTVRPTQPNTYKEPGDTVLPFSHRYRDMDTDTKFWT